MYEAGLGFWGVVGPAAGVAAAGYGLYRVQQSEVRGRIEDPLQRRCREATGGECSSAQINDMCRNMTYNQIRDDFPTCIPRVPAAQFFQLREGYAQTDPEIAAGCEMEQTLGNPLPGGCQGYIARERERQRQLAALYPSGRQWGPETESERAQRMALTKGTSMQGLGFTAIAGGAGRATCDEVPDGEQFCFRTTTVDGQAPEQVFARNQGCLPLSSGARCETTPYGNPGLKWCCPPGWPRSSGAGPLRAGEFPPAPPGLGNKLRFYVQYWWFWALALGVPVAGYLGYQYLKDEGYLGGDEELFALEEEAERY